jgi:hypothetical protein
MISIDTTLRDANKMYVRDRETEGDPTPILL